MRALALDFGTSFGDGFARAGLRCGISLADYARRAPNGTGHPLEQSHGCTDEAASSPGQGATAGETKSEDTWG